MKRTAAFFLTVTISILALLLSACAGPAVAPGPSKEEPAEDPNYEAETVDPEPEDEPEPVEEPEDPNYAKGKPVKTCSGIRHVRNNNIEIETVSVTTESGESEGSYIKISGLKDKDVQNSINSQIREQYFQLTDPSYLPPYTGSKVRIKKLGLDAPTHTYFSAYVNANFSNILSVELSGSWNFERPSEEYSELNYLYLYETRTLNFDLNTGKQIRLTDLFADDVDALGYINGIVSDKIMKAGDQEQPMWYDIGPVLSGSFTGIREDQSYYVDQYSGDIKLVFDYHDPAFRAVSYPIEISIPMRGVSAMDQRFAGTDLFEDDSVSYRFFWEDDDPDDRISFDIYENGAYPFEGLDVQYMENGFYYEDMTDTQKLYASLNDESRIQFKSRFLEILCDLSKELDPGPDETVQTGYYDGQNFALPGDLYAYISFYSNCSRIGNYVNIDVSRSFNVANNETWDTYYSDYWYNGFCFREGGDDPLEIQDIFRDRGSVGRLLKKAFRANIERYSYVTLSAYDSRAITAFYDYMLSNISGFTLNPESISIHYYEDPLDRVMEYIYDDDAKYAFANSCQYADYDDIGCENLNIFD